MTVIIDPSSISLTGTTITVTKGDVIGLVVDSVVVVVVVIVCSKMIGRNGLVVVDILGVGFRRRWQTSI